MNIGELVKKVVDSLDKNDVVLGSENTAPNISHINFEFYLDEQGEINNKGINKVNFYYTFRNGKEN